MAHDEDDDEEGSWSELLEPLFEPISDGSAISTHILNCEYGIVKYRLHGESLGSFVFNQVRSEFLIKDQIEEILETDPNMTLEQLKHYEDVLGVEIVSYHPARRRGGGKAPLI